MARNSAGVLIVSGARLIVPGTGSARALRAHPLCRERSLPERRVSLNRGRKCNRTPRFIDHARISQECKQLAAQLSAPPLGRLALPTLRRGKRPKNGPGDSCDLGGVEDS